MGLRRAPLLPEQSWLLRPQDAGPKRVHYSQTPRAQSPLNPFYTWCNMLLTGLHRSPISQHSSSSPHIFPYSLFTSSLFFPPSLHTLELEVIIIIIISAASVDGFSCSCLLYRHKLPIPYKKTPIVCLGTCAKK